jgi:ATP-binding cassette subfamily F protein uup
LSDALSDWGEERGAIVVISHDKAFCEKVGFTHVATVKEGRLVMETRNTRESDWDSSTFSSQPTLLSNEEEGTESSSGASAAVTKVDKAVRKQAYNAPKRIAKIESLIEKKETKMAELDSEMLSNGRDFEKLLDLTKQKEALETEVMELMEEWEQLEEILEVCK